ncbi:LANO_0G10154g1_1 [Lachancea nothofagi CBS 11611]|uniref:LANO_0G10154g1_1 n=1 Tax=Lachancea nothofagi CBS 11611 TaxID=1266666 RepID=A0A1G4KIX0_9SACH|nr:LANO_0G10154g1_1 [Lachancea nothofagi CBS 11611]
MNVKINFPSKDCRVKMLRFGSRRYLTSFQKSDAKLQEFYKYHATNASLRPWIYRPRNANTLLAMDLKDPDSDAPLKPRSPVKPLSRQVLNTYIWSAQEASQLLDLLHKWTSLTTRKLGIWSYFTADHVQNILFASTFKLGKLSSFLKHLYLWRPRFEEAQNAGIFDVEHFFNSVITCQLHRNNARNLCNAETARSKLVMAWNQVAAKENKTGLTLHLVGALSKQQGFDINDLSFPGLAKVDVNLPVADVESLKSGRLAAFLSQNRFHYVMAQTIMEFGDAPEPVRMFVANYKAAANKLGRPDVYQEYRANAKLLATEPKPPTTASPHPAAES